MATELTLVGQLIAVLLLYGGGGVLVCIIALRHILLLRQQVVRDARRHRALVVLPDLQELHAACAARTQVYASSHAGSGAERAVYGELLIAPHMHVQRSCHIWMFAKSGLEAHLSMMMRVHSMQSSFRT